MQHQYIEGHAQLPCAGPDTVCTRNLFGTLLSAFAVFVTFWSQVHATNLSHYLSDMLRPNCICRAEDDGDEEDHGAAAPSRSIYNWIVDKKGVIVDWLLMGLMAMAYPFMCFTLSIFTAMEALSMKKAMIAVGYRQSNERWPNPDSKSFDPPTVGVLIGGKVFLSIPDGDGVTSYRSITYARRRNDRGNRKNIAKLDTPLLFFPAMLLNTDCDPHIELFNRRRTCIQLNTTGKAVLLKLGYVPTYDQLRQIKYKSGWEIAIFGCNAAGYLLEVLSRLVSHQSISPIEVKASFVAVLMILQPIMQIFTGGLTPLFKQTLLIHLTDDQLTRVVSYADAVDMGNIDPNNNFSPILTKARLYETIFVPDQRQPASHYHNVLTVKQLDFHTVQLVHIAAVLASVCLAIWYFISQFVINHCYLCGVPAILFSINTGIYVSLIIISQILGPTSEDNRYKFYKLALRCILIMSGAVLTLSIVATAVKWNEMSYYDRTKAWYSLLLPHF